MNGPEHKQHRRMVMGPFQKRAIGGYHEAMLDLAADMLDDWRAGEVRDVSREMTQFMLRLTSGLLFGFGADVFDTAYATGEKIDRWVQLNHSTGLGAFVSNPKYVASYDELCGLAGELERDIQEMIDRRRSSGRPGSDVLSLLIEAHGRDGGISDQELIGHVALLFGAAHLTTAHTFSWTLFLLAQHPHVMRQLDEEIGSTIAGDCPSLEEIARMPVLDRVLKESMRVLPASGCSHRVTSRATTLGPLELPKGAPVIFSQYVTHHLPSLYPDPEAFHPDRWLSISPSAYEYLPFGAGPRMCLGAPLATMILKTVLPTILKRYRLSVVPGCEINGNIVSTMLGPTTPLPMTIHPADGRFESVAVQGNVHQMVNLPGSDRLLATAFPRAA
jgi:cytochrome P450